MLLKNCLFVVVSIVTLGLSGLAQDPPDEEEAVRGTFLISRPASRKTASKPGTASAGAKRTPRPRTRPAGTTPPVSKDGEEPKAVKPGVSSKGPIGLGYSLFTADKGGNPVRVDPSRVFHANERIRISLESNTNGYLYVFYTENDGQPQMLFPDPRLANGENRIEAHVPYEVPSSLESNPAHRWFVFDNKPAVEKLYVLVSREPLQSVPVGAKLTEYCSEKKLANCLWGPDQETWSSVTRGLNRSVKTSKSMSFGQPQTEDEAEATLRRIGLPDNAPEPSIVRMNASADAPMLLTVIELVHQ